LNSPRSNEGIPQKVKDSALLLTAGFNHCQDAFHKAATPIGLGCWRRARSWGVMATLRLTVLVADISNLPVDLLSPIAPNRGAGMGVELRFWGRELTEKWSASTVTFDDGLFRSRMRVYEQMMRLPVNLSFQRLLVRRIYRKARNSRDTLYHRRAKNEIRDAVIRETIRCALYA
jgi:hypothetical protein